jgi:hypothetical protein
MSNRLAFVFLTGWMGCCVVAMATSLPVGAVHISTSESGPSILSTHVIVVTTGIDEDDGSINPALGTGTSLREAIAHANSLSGSVRIDISSLVAFPIVLKSELPPLVNPHGIEMDGNGAGLEAAVERAARTWAAVAAWARARPSQHS